MGFGANAKLLTKWHSSNRHTTPSMGFHIVDIDVINVNENHPIILIACVGNAPELITMKIFAMVESAILPN